MDTPCVLLVCTLLLTCSVWTAHGRSSEVSVDDQEQGDVGMAVKGGKLPGVCWACKWALNKVIKAKLLSVCDQIGLLKPLCRKLVKSHLSVLIEEMTTSDDVRTICVNIGACKSKELMDIMFYPSEEDSKNQIVLNAA